MKFPDYLKRGDVNKVQIDTIRAKSFIIASKEAIETAKDISLEEPKLRSILRELYEGLRQFCEAIGYIQGYKFNSHEIITIFLAEVLQEDSIAHEFDRYRKIRNGINDYGNAVSEETVKEALVEIPKLIKLLEKYTQQ